MLVKLSSDNEPDPTKFGNNFSEGMVIKPFSKVCLIKGQITRIDQGKKVKVSAGTLINVRYTPYDLIQLTLNPAAETTYTLDAFCAYVHTLLPNGTAWNRGAKFMNVSGQAGVADLEWIFYWTIENPLHYETFMYGHEHYKRQYLNAVNGKNYPSVGGSGGNTPQIGGDGGNWACGVAWNPAVYTVPPLQVNGNAHNMLVSGQGENRTEFIIGQPDLRNLKISFGNSTHDGVNYTSGAIVGTPGYDNPGGTPGNMLLNFNFKATGKLDIEYFNHTNNAMEMVYTNEVYNPGDIWNLHGHGSTHFDDPDRYFYLMANVKRGNGLAYWIPGITSLAGTDTEMTLNDGTGLALTIALDQFYITHINSPVAFSITRFGNLNMDTEWTATGYRFTAGFSLDVSGEADANSLETVSGGAELISDGINDIVEGLTGEPNAWLNGAFFLERYTGAAPAAQPDKKAVCSLATNGIPLTTPFYIGFFFQPADDTAFQAGGGNNNMTILGSHTGSAPNPVFVEVNIGNTETWELQFIEQDATTQQVALLLNGTGARLNIALAGNYHFSMCYMGTGVGTGTGQIIFRMYDIDNDLLYHNIPAATMIGASGLPKLSYWGGSLPTDTANFAKWSCAYYADFRLYEKCSDTTGHTVNLWDNIQTELQTYWGTGVKTAEWFFGETPYEVILPTAGMTNAAGRIEPQYVVAGLPRPETTITQIYQRPVAADSLDTDWYDIINAYSPGATHLTNNKRLTTLAAPSYAGNQTGLVETTDIGNSLDFIDPTADGNANVLTARRSIGVGGDGETHPYATLEIDLEDTVLQRETINIELTNLPHRSYNGTNGSVDKTIYQMPLATHSTAIDNLEILEVIPPSKVWLELNNPGEIPLNRLEIQLSDSSGKKLNELNYSQPTNIVVEIKNKDDIIN